MDFSSINPVLLLASLMVASTPILLAALGELVTEKAGVLNLGVEGMMITGAVAGFIAAQVTGSTTLGYLGAGLGGALLSLIFAFLTQILLANQVAAGLALTLFGLGFASLLGQPWIGVKSELVTPFAVPLLSEIPVLGAILFKHDAMVYVSLLLCLAVWYVLTRTRIGLILRAVGENHDAAHALGYKVVLVRTFAIMFGGAMAGLGGAYLSLVRVPQWTEGVTAGAGWIALSIVVFASWRTGRLIVGAYLFGGISVLQLNLQLARVPVPVEVLAMAPYIITIVALVMLSASKRTSSGPGALGTTFYATQ